MKKIDRSSKVRTGFHQAKWDEPVIFELSRAGERGILVPQASDEVKKAVEGAAVLPAVLKRQAAPADFLAAGQGDCRIARVELPVCLFIRLLHPADSLHHVLGGDIFVVYGGGVTDKAQHSAVGAHPGVHLHVIVLGEAADKGLHQLLPLVWF